MSDDTISRQVAIDAIRKCNVKEVTPAYMLIDKAEAVTELMMLPSVQPEIIRCKDCKFSDEFDGDVWLCRRRKESFRVLAIDTCNVAKRRTDE